MDLKLRSIHVNNHKSLKSIEIKDISDFNVFIGKNNSGKSAVFEALHFLQLFIKNDFEEVVFYNLYGIKNLTELKFEEADSIVFGVEFEVVGAGSKQTIRYIIETQDGVNFTDSIEVSSIFPTIYGSTKTKQSPGINKEVYYYNKEKNFIMKKIFKMGKLEGEVKIESRKKKRGLILNSIIDDDDLNRFSNSITQFLSSMWFLSCNRHVKPKTETSGEDKVNYDGSNTLQVFSKIRGARSLEYRDILASMKEIFPSIIEDIPEERTDKLEGMILEKCWSARDRRFPWQHVGMGVYMVLPMVTEAYNPYNPNSILFTEEPELYLHPEAQRNLFNFLRAISRRKQVFITTHSTVFIDKVDPRNVYFVTKEGDETKVEKMTSYEGLWPVLDDLGARNSDILLSDSVVFVEGPSDAKILNVFADKLDYPLKDFGVVVAHLGGLPNIENQEIDGLMRLNRKFIFVLNSHRKTKKGDLDPKLKHIQDMCKKVGRDCIILNKNEIENYLSSRAIEKVLGLPKDSIRFGDYDNVKEITEKQGKKLGRLFTYNKIRHGVKIAKEMEAKEIDPEIKEIIDDMIKSVTS